jgi:peptidoglycan-associated lipoprotein
MMQMTMRDVAAHGTNDSPRSTLIPHIRTGVRRPRLLRLFVIVSLLSVGLAACSRNNPPVARPMPPPPPADTTAATRPPAPPEPVREPTIVPPLPDDGISASASGSLEELNKNSPLKPVFYEYDSSELTPAGQAALDENAGVLKRFASWAVTIEGHCDERGTAEYNLALGERRAVTARAYLVSLGIAADRLRTVSYGKEFPFDPGKDEAAYAKNRRAHFVITGK